MATSWNVAVDRFELESSPARSRSFDGVARAQGISRAALIRRLIDPGLDQTDSDLESDLAAIEASFNVLSGEENFLERGTDDRSRHLGSVRGKRRSSSTPTYSSRISAVSAKRGTGCSRPAG
ncbi:MAG: hypothetical protein ACLQRM_10805 [Acidimicrobiales bacterium]